MSLTPDDAARLLTRLLRQGGAYADVFFEETCYHRHTLRHRLGRGGFGAPALTAQRDDIRGAGLRVLAGGSEGYAHTSDPGRAAVEAAADEAAAHLGATGAPLSPAPFASPARYPAPADAPDALAASEKAALLRTAADAAFASDPDVVAVEVAYQDRLRQTCVATSDGVFVEAAVPLVGLRVAVTLRQGAHAHAVGGARDGLGFFFAHPPEALAQEAVARAQAIATAQPLTGGAMPVVVAGGWGGVWLHEAVGHLLEADVAARHGIAPGRRLGGPHITLYDDGTWPGGRATAVYDDEGTPAARTALVDAGEVVGLLADRRRAALLDLPRTGNGRRQDYRHAPLPRMTNLCLAPGTASAADLVADVRDGLYVACVGQGIVVPAEDHFSFEVTDGFRIEDGRRTAPVAGLRVQGKLSAVLEGLAGVADDFALDAARGQCRKAGQVLPVSVGTPTVLLEGLEVVQEAAERRR